MIIDHLNSVSITILSSRCYPRFLDEYLKFREAELLARIESL